MKSEFNTKPDKIQYMPLPSGEADVWLRKDIHQEEIDGDDGKYTMWTADEVYFRAKITLEEVEENFDALFENGGPVEDPDTGTSNPNGITLEMRLEAVEDAVAELGSIIGGITLKS